MTDTADASTVVLTDEQGSAVDTLASLRKDVQTLGGFAGTGKTTVLRVLSARLRNFAVCAYTGKAAHVLRRKGIAASTIHSLIYKPIPDESGGVTFELRDPMEFMYGGVIVDEASMVGADIYRDLKSLGVPLIFVGDHGQLEPVGSAAFNLMESPDITLERIHRNAGEIAAFAEHLRGGGEPQDWVSTEGKVDVVTTEELGETGTVGDANQIICAYNRTRVDVNQMVREHYGREGNTPVVGDRVICLRNDRKTGLFNGMQGDVTAVDRRSITIDSGENLYTARYDPSAFGAERTPERRADLIPFDFAYCVTCHKSQGDEWDHVIVVEQRCSRWDHKRWRYTAASRAKEKLTWVLG